MNIDQSIQTNPKNTSIKDLNVSDWLFLLVFLGITFVFIIIFDFVLDLLSGAFFILPTILLGGVLLRGRVAARSIEKRARAK